MPEYVDIAIDARALFVRPAPARELVPWTLF